MEAYTTQVLQSRLSLTSRLPTHLGCVLHDDPRRSLRAWNGRDVQRRRSGSDLEAVGPVGGTIPLGSPRCPAVIGSCMREAGIRFAELTAVAAAAGPGLIGGVIVGLTTAKAIALVHDIPLIAVNHLEAHALTPRLTGTLAFPYCLFLASGGHTQVVAVLGVGNYVRLGTTVDDAIGEAFDKVAKMLGLPYPGGPQVERSAAGGDPERLPCRGRCWAAPMPISRCRD